MLIILASLLRRGYLILEGGDDDKRNRLEAAVDQLHGKMGIDALRTGRQFSRAYDRSAKQKPANTKPPDDKADQ